MRWMTYVTASVCSGWSVQSSAVQNASAVAAPFAEPARQARHRQRPAHDAEEREAGQQMDGHIEDVISPHAAAEV